MSYVHTIARIILGLIFFIFGLNGFFLFIPVPPMAPEGQTFIDTLINTGYMLPLWKGAEVLAGFLLLINKAVPFALILLAPIVINIFFFHLVLDPANAVLGVILVLLMLITAWQHRRAFKSLFV